MSAQLELDLNAIERGINLLVLNCLRLSQADRDLQSTSISATNLKALSSLKTIDRRSLGPLTKEALRSRTYANKRLYRRRAQADLAVQLQLNISYADDLPVVLKNVSFSIKPGEKIGLVGRTGSGKSTFGLALLRFVEAQSGRLIIDGIDVSTIGLSDLRRNITVMSQDAVLFAGTIKENLDPFDEHDTNELWDVLLKVGMAGDPGSAPSTAEPSRAASLDNAAAAAEEGTSSGSSDTAVGIRSKAAISSLDDLVAENGNNFSAGERQLLALARALLRRPKILLMDEASSSIDKAADARLQGFIKDAFASSTVITIAHRLLTVCEYDRILVLDAGQVVEYDSPKALLSQGRGFFYDLCIKTTESDEIFSALGENKPAQQAT